MTLDAGEQLCAFLDDIHVLCQSHRVKTIYDELAWCLFRVAGNPIGNAQFVAEKSVPELRRSKGCGWRSLREGQRPPRARGGRQGEWRHDWQYWSSSVSDSHFSTVGQLLALLTCALTLGSTPAQLWRTVPRPRSTPYCRTCSDPPA